MSANNQDDELEIYLEEINKTMDDGEETLVTLQSESINTLPEADDESKQILHSGSDGKRKKKMISMEGTFIMDVDGSCYYHNPEKQIPDIKLPQLTTTTPMQTRARTYSKFNSNTPIKTGVSKVDPKDENIDPDIVLFLEETVEEENEKTQQSDSSKDNKDNVYEFDVNDEVDATENLSSFTGTTTVSKVKSVTSRNAGDNDIKHSFSCVQCEYSTNKRYLLSRHIKTHSEERPFKCSVCERGFKTNVSLINHVNTHLGNKPHACQACPMAFTTTGELVRHMRYRHTGEKPHKCGECDYSSVELSKLRRHMRCHTGERPYQCPDCTYASPDAFKLKRHMRTHTGEKPYQCQICQSRFTQSNSLKAHNLIHSIGSKPVFQCEICPTTCGRKTDLRLHMQKLHHSDHPIICKRCGKSLPDRYSYKLHIKSHDGEKCYRCKICPYASVSMRHLESHMLIHTDEKPFSCEHCKMTFRQQQLLLRHTNLYHNKNYTPPKPREKTECCPHCDRSFTHKGNLMRHMETHDPASKIEEQKMQLKIGRMTRIKSDGTLGTINDKVWEGEIIDQSTYEVDGNEEIEIDNDNPDNTDNEENIEEYDIIETIEEMDEKPIIEEQDIKDEIIKETIQTRSKNAYKKELMEVNITDVEKLVIEVIECDEEEDDDYNDGAECITIADSNVLEIPMEEKSEDNIEYCSEYDDEEVESNVELINTLTGNDGTVRMLQLINEVDGDEIVVDEIDYEEE